MYSKNNIDKIKPYFWFHIGVKLDILKLIEILLLQ